MKYIEIAAFLAFLAWLTYMLDPYHGKPRPLSHALHRTDLGGFDAA
jgi:hypothetical protein